jgi:hypothetical protein
MNADWSPAGEPVAGGAGGSRPGPTRQAQALVGEGRASAMAGQSLEAMAVDFFGPLGDR